ATLQQAITRALEEAAPDLLGIEVEGLAPVPEPGAAAPSPNGGASPSLGPSLPLIADVAPRVEATPAPAWKGLEDFTRRASDAGHCDFCAVGLGHNHRHLLQLDERRIVCVCESCWALHSGDPAYRPAGARTIVLDDFRL